MLNSVTRLTRVKELTRVIRLNLVTRQLSLLRRVVAVIGLFTVIIATQAQAQDLIGKPNDDTSTHGQTRDDSASSNADAKIAVPKTNAVDSNAEIAATKSMKLAQTVVEQGQILLERVQYQYASAIRNSDTPEKVNCLSRVRGQVVAEVSNVVALREMMSQAIAGGDRVEITNYNADLMIKSDRFAQLDTESDGCVGDSPTDTENSLDTKQDAEAARAAAGFDEDQRRSVEGVEGAFAEDLVAFPQIPPPASPDQ